MDCSVVVSCILFRFCSRLGVVVVLVFVLECRVLISSIFSRCVSMMLCVGCLVWYLLFISCISVCRCVWVCIIIRLGSSESSSGVLGEVKM